VEDDTREVWEAAARADDALQLREEHWPLLRKRRVLPEPYSRARMFEAMSRAEPVLFTGFTVPIARRNGESIAEAAEFLIRTGFPEKNTARVQLGPSRLKTRKRVPEIMARWSRRKALVGVIDLHFRGTTLAPNLGIEVLSDFNVLITGSDAMAEQEMMTVVIASAGNVTTAHTDDPDGSNHCYTGRKLWMTWESFEGSAKGIQDSSRDECDGPPHFDLDKFLTLDSASWWTISAGQTLFLPGKMTHRVVTLEHYLGVGSFYVALPGCLQTISRWHAHEPVWVSRHREYAGVLDEVTRALTARIRMLRDATDADRDRWGVAYVRDSVMRWEREEQEEHRAKLLANRDFAELLEVARDAR
jgi:hypothetical protein